MSPDKIKAKCHDCGKQAVHKISITLGGIGEPFSVCEKCYQKYIKYFNEFYMEKP